MTIFCTDMIKTVPDELVQIARERGTRYECEENGISVTMYLFNNHWYVGSIKDNIS